MMSLHLSNFWMPYDSRISLISLCANISLGAGENLIICHHMIITIPAELWGLITHILVYLCVPLVYLWELLLAGGMKEKEIISLCYLRLHISKNFSRALLAFAFLAITFWSIECVAHNRNRGPYELRTRDWHSVQDEEHILLDCPHEHLVSACTQHRQLAFPPQYEDSPARLRTFLNQPGIYSVASFVAKCLALFPWFSLESFWFSFRLFPSFRSDAPQRHI